MHLPYNLKVVSNSLAVGVPSILILSILVYLFLKEPSIARVIRNHFDIDGGKIKLKFKRRQWWNFFSKVISIETTPSKQIKNYLTKAQSAARDLSMHCSLANFEKHDSRMTWKLYNTPKRIIVPKNSDIKRLYLGNDGFNDFFIPVTQKHFIRFMIQSGGGKTTFAAELLKRISRSLPVQKILVISNTLTALKATNVENARYFDFEEESQLLAFLNELKQVVTVEIPKRKISMDQANVEHATEVGYGYIPLFLEELQTLLPGHIKPAGYRKEIQDLLIWLIDNGRKYGVLLLAFSQDQDLNRISLPVASAQLALFGRVKNAAIAASNGIDDIWINDASLTMGKYLLIGDHPHRPIRVMNQKKG